VRVGAIYAVDTNIGCIKGVVPVMLPIVDRWTTIMKQVNG
jgi:hypothetical protein